MDSPLDTHVRTGSDNGAVGAFKNFDDKTRRDDTALVLLDHHSVTRSANQAAVVTQTEDVARSENLFTDPDHILLALVPDLGLGGHREKGGHTSSYKKQQMFRDRHNGDFLQKRRNINSEFLDGEPISLRKWHRRDLGSALKRTVAQRLTLNAGRSS